MPGPLLGAHMPTGKGLGSAIREARTMGCEAAQVFTNSPQTWRAKAITDDMVAAFRLALEETGVGPVVSHDSYLINLCALEPEKREQSIRGMRAEIERCARYGIDRVVSHLGAHMGQGADAALAIVADSLRQVLDESPESVTILMETTAGQGTCLMAEFGHHARLLEALKGHPRLGVCLDTCHVFAAGYELRTPDAVEAMLTAFQTEVGLDRLRAIHANDSAKPFGSRKDRHAHIGEGEIGEEAFRALVNDARLAGIPMLLETPIEEQGHERDLAKLMSYRIA